MAMTETELQAELIRLRAEVATRRKKSIKVGEKGGVVVDLGGRYPLSAYKEQMTKLLDFGPTIRQFIADNESKLKSKQS